MPERHQITPQEALQRTIEHREIFHDEMLHLMRLIMGGEMSPVMVAALITGLRVKKETIGEITAAAQVMREFSTKVDVADKTHLVDIVGTGGDGSNTFNISTCSMFVAAAAGARVSKHGGRSVSSKSGSADVLDSLGVNINLKPEQIARSIAEVAVSSGADEDAVAAAFETVCTRWTRLTREHLSVARRELVESGVMAPVRAGSLWKRLRTRWRVSRGLPPMKLEPVAERPDYDFLVTAWSHRARKEKDAAHEHE